MNQHNRTPELTQKPAWNAVYALSLGVAGLITSEFLPVSLLTPMATDLHITEGIAGQSISITALVAMLAFQKSTSKVNEMNEFDEVESSTKLVAKFSSN